MPNDGVDVLNVVHMARAVPLLWQSSLDEAEEHARRAVAAIADWDMPKAKGDSLVLLGDVLNAAGRTDEAIAAYAEALALYEQKENLVGAGRVSESLALLQAETTM
ncbi:MAG: tetratricopeptide repeat protein [Actinobacteria bacterium]|nr:MAG: tetratricopeptide repeat protein [Actinomycetota bacterium]